MNRKAAIPGRLTADYHARLVILNPPIATNPSTRTWPVLLLGAGLLALPWFVYLPALHGTPLWDDRIMVTEARVLVDPHALQRIWFDPRASPDYFPLTLTFLWLQVKLWGVSDLTPYHAVNVIVHGLNVLLVWRLLVKLELKGAFLAAALFAVDPVMVESVAWVSEIKNTFSGFFAIAAVIWFVRPATWTSSLMAAALFAMAMLAKSAVVGLPVVLVIILWWKQLVPAASRLASLAMMFTTAAGLSAIALWTQVNVIGTTGPEFDRTPLQTLSIFGPAVLFYIGKLLWPVHVYLLYPHWSLPTHLSWQHALSAGVVVGGVVLWWGRQRWGRAPFSAVMIFLVLLAPVLGFLKFYTQRYSFVADHYTYLACIPVLAAASYVVSCFGRWAVPAGVAAVTACAFLSWQDSHHYVSELAVFQHVVAEDPGNWEGNAMIAVDLTKKNRDAEAEPYFLRAIQTYPQGGELWVGLGEIAERRKQYDTALEDYQRAVALRPLSPIVHFDLANMLLIYRRVPEAIAEYRAAIDLEPGLVEAHDNLGVALLKTQDRTGAEAEFREALSINPTFTSARHHLAALTAAPTGVSGNARP